MQCAGGAFRCRCLAPRVDRLGRHGGGAAGHISGRTAGERSRATDGALARLRPHRYEFAATLSAAARRRAYTSPRWRALCKPLTSPNPRRVRTPDRSHALHGTRIPVPVSAGAARGVCGGASRLAQWSAARREPVFLRVRRAAIRRGHAGVHRAELRRRPRDRQRCNPAIRARIAHSGRDGQPGAPRRVQVPVSWSPT